MNPYKAIAFDLDDTLLDTSRLLVPQAAQDACSVLLQEGLQCDLQTCLQWRQRLAAQTNHDDIFLQIAQQFQCPQPQAAAQKALQQYFSMPIPASLPLMEGAEKNLRELQKNYALYLVTLGNPETQKQKIQAMNISSLFREVFILNGLKGERKEGAFRQILQKEKILPEQLLSVGNRLSSEIRDGKKCGADTCHFAYGEHVGEVPTQPEDQPDFTFHHHRELITVCGL